MSDFGKFLRDTRIPSSREMSVMAVTRYEKSKGKITAENLRKNFSEILSQCILIEKQLFDEIDSEIRGEWVMGLLGNAERSKRFPTINRMVNEAIATLEKSGIAVGEKLSSIVHSLEEVNSGLSLSQQNSAKSRAGSAFQNYLEHFFDILGFRYERQRTLDSGEKLDLIFPDVDTLKRSPQDCIMMECQTTLKDRFRLSLGKGQSLPGIAKFIATATGANLITDRDHADLSSDKIKEIRDKQYRLVALKQVSDKWANPAIISFEDFVNTQYPSRSGLW